MKREASQATPTCPACGADVAADAVICGSCDHILDASFLDEAAQADLDDEGTDPGGAAPPALEDEGTDPGGAAPPGLEDEGTDPGLGPTPADLDDGGTDPGSELPTMVGDDALLAEASDPTKVGPAPTPPDPDDPAGMKTMAGLPEEEDDPLGSAEYDDFGAVGSPGASPPPPSRPSTPARPARPTPPPPDPVAAPRPVPPPPPARPGAAPPTPSRSRSASGTGSAPGLISASGSASGDGRTKRPTLRETLDFDTSSELMDDYDKFFQEVWRRFVAAPVAEKIVASGAVLALLTVLMPWRVVISDAGLPQERIGLVVGGWLVLLLAGGTLALAWMKLTRPKMNQSQLLFGQLGLAGLGLLWSGVGLLAGFFAAASAPEHTPVQPGPAYGVVLCGLAWAITLAGGLLGLKDALLAGSKKRPRPPVSPSAE